MFKAAFLLLEKACVHITNKSGYPRTDDLQAQKEIGDGNGSNPRALIKLYAVLIWYSLRTDLKSSNI